MDDRGSGWATAGRLLLVGAAVVACLGSPRANHAQPKIGVDGVCADGGNLTLAIAAWTPERLDVDLLFADRSCRAAIVGARVLTAADPLAPLTPPDEWSQSSRLHFGPVPDPSTLEVELDGGFIFQVPMREGSLGKPVVIHDPFGHHPGAVQP